MNPITINSDIKKVVPMTEIKIADLLMHPVRMRILLCLAGVELSPKEMADRLPDVAHATLYRHIGKLEKAGVLNVVREKKMRGATERTYALATSEHLDLSEEFQRAGQSEQLQYFLTFVVSLLQDFALHLTRREETPRNDYGFHSVVVNLSEEEFIKVMTRMNELLGPLLSNKPVGDRTAWTLSTLVIPRPEE